MKKTLFAICAIALSFAGCKKDKIPQVSSVQTTVNPGGWIYNSNEWEYTTTISSPSITQDILDHGLVMVYIKGSAGGWMGLPSTYYYGGGTSATLNFQALVGQVIIYADLSDNSTLTFGVHDFKVVTITKNQKAAHPTTNWRNYNEAMEAAMEANESHL